MIPKNIFFNQSRTRRLENQWYVDRAKIMKLTPKTLDLGGVAGADYHALLGLKRENIIVWNFDPKANPDKIVDLEDIAGLPSFPKECHSVIAANLLEHIFLPLDLLTWICSGLQPGGQLLVVVPFAYPIHPSPKDLWRITPQGFEVYFSELAKRKGISGQLEISPLGQDLREITAPFTASLFKSALPQRLLANSLERAAQAGSSILELFGGSALIAKLAKDSPPAIGVAWRKD